MMPKNGPQMALSIAARTGAATIGGYVASYAAAAALSRILPMARAEVVILTALAAIVLNVVIALWAFGSRSIWRTWLILITCSLALYGFAFWWPA